MKLGDVSQCLDVNHTAHQIHYSGCIHRYVSALTKCIRASLNTSVFCETVGRNLTAKNKIYYSGCIHKYVSALTKYIMPVP